MRGIVLIILILKLYYNNIIVDGFVSVAISKYSYNHSNIIRSINGGKSWDIIPYNNTNDNYIMNDVIINNNNVIAVGNNGTILINKGNNNISSWTTPPSKWLLSNTNNIKFDLTSIIFINNTRGICVGYFGTILLSNDGGDNWNSIQTNTLRHIYDVDFAASPRELYGIAVGSVGQIMITTDGGSTWNIKSSSSITYNLYSVAIYDHFIAFVTGPKGLILRTNDFGNSWNIINAYESSTTTYTSSVFGILPSITSVALIVGDNKILKSVDQSLTFNEIFINNIQQCHSVYMLNHEIGIIGCRYQLLLTRDSGITWNIISEPIELFSKYINHIISIYMIRSSIFHATLSHNIITLSKIEDFLFYIDIINSGVDILHITHYNTNDTRIKPINVPYMTTITLLPSAEHIYKFSLNRNNFDAGNFTILLEFYHDAPSKITSIYINIYVPTQLEQEPKSFFEENWLSFTILICVVLLPFTWLLYKVYKYYKKRKQILRTETEVRLMSFGADLMSDEVSILSSKDSKASSLEDEEIFDWTDSDEDRYSSNRSLDIEDDDMFDNKSIQSSSFRRNSQSITSLRFRRPIMEHGLLN